MLPLNELLMLLAAGVIFYVIRQWKSGTNKSKVEDNEFDIEQNQPNLFNDSMKDINSPERQWNATNIHNSSYHRNHDGE